MKLTDNILILSNPIFPLSFHFKFRYSEKDTKFGKKNVQNFAAFSEISIDHYE